MNTRQLGLIVIAMAAWSTAARAQVSGSDSPQLAGRDSLPLGALQDSAVLRDPRGRELALLTAQSRLRQQNLVAERRPTLSLEGLVAGKVGANVVRAAVGTAFTRGHFARAV